MANVLKFRTLSLSFIKSVVGYLAGLLVKIAKSEDTDQKASSGSALFG